MPVGYDWMLPTRTQYTVTEKQGKCGKLPRVGTVTCQFAENVLVHWRDGLVERRTTFDVVPNDARRLGELIAQRHAYSEQLAQGKKELLEAQRQL